MSGPRALCGEELKIFKTTKGFMSRMRIRYGRFRFFSKVGFATLLQSSQSDKQGQPVQRSQIFTNTETDE